MRMLGKKAPRHDPRTLRFARYLTAQLPPPPDSVDYTTKVSSWPMYLNDQEGDCTCAGAAHMIQGWTAAASGSAVTISNQDVQKAYIDNSGFDPTTGANDNGCVEIDVLNYWRKTGIGDHKIGAFARVSVRDASLVRAGTYLFGGLYLGLALPITAQTQDTWDWTGSLSGDAAPGSWGGHAVDVVAYDDRALTIVTWGALKQMTWTFFDRYCDEAYAILSTDYLAEGKAPSGFDLDALKQDLALVTN